MLTFYLSLVEDHSNDDDFERIYHKYSKMMYKVAKYHTKDHHLAEDAVQNVLINVARNIDKIKSFDEDYLEIYLCKATKNSSFSIMKKEKRIASHTIPLDNAYNADISCELISEKVLQNELLKTIHSYIMTMETQCRDILAYYFLHNFTLKEISIIMNIPLSTVKTKFYKIRKMINEKFEEYKNDRS